MALKLVEKESQNFPGLSWRVIDIVASPEIGVKYGVFSTPAIAINGRLMFRGIPKEKKFRKKLKDELKKSGD